VVKKAEAETEDLDAMLEEIEREAGIEAQKFDSVDDFFDSIASEKKGRWCQVPFLPEGDVVLIAHSSAAKRQVASASLEYKRKNKIPLGEGLDIFGLMQVIPPAYYKTVVRGWRIKKRDGSQFPFNEENYKRFMDDRRFFEFVTDSANTEDARRAAEEDELGEG